jgi:hypothetical protein
MSPGRPTAHDLTLSYNLCQLSPSGAQEDLVSLATSGAQCAFWALDLPVPTREPLADAGGLLAYGAPLRKAARHMARHVDKILRDSLAGELPIEVASDQDPAINLSTARHLGVKVPPKLLTQADQTIK